ncbi:MAG: DUF3467 domain-containing protein [Pirellulaceae bacterium]|jgi:hypothetical protein|nr:DUF3467 domain-containing protein [Pirellulaceae bacterium]MDP7018406.1 DUF3467 domain-containing protein [Pirellulaceae bacterium]
MSEETPQPGDSQHEQVRAQHVSARVPESVSRGVFSTGVITMTGSSEFVIDFVQNIGPPASVAARIVMPHAVMPQFIDALNKNYDLYKERFGEPAQPPRPQNQGRRPSVQEIYDELKIPDEVLPGSYANGLMIGHTASEFKLDFLTNLFPNSAVSCRVFLSAPQVPRMLESLSTTYQQFAQRVQQQRQGQGPPQPDTTADPPPPTDVGGEPESGPDSDPPGAPDEQ